MTLVYSDKPNCVNLLLIDRYIPSVELFSTSTNDITLPIIYSYEDTKEELMTLLQSKFTSIGRIGIVFSYSGPSKLFLDNQTFFESDILISLIQTYNVTNIDFLACNTLQDAEWTNYYTLLSETGVIVGASNDKTGNITYGGDWVMESTNEDIEMIYFTESIKYYSYLLDTTSKHTLVINENNKIWSCGYNEFGQLGQGNIISGTANNENYVITEINNVSNVTLCATSLKNSYIYSGTKLYSCGHNNKGQIATGNVDQNNIVFNTFEEMKFFVSTPPSATPVKLISGYLVVAVIYSNQTVYVCGNNSHGQLCRSTLTDFRLSSLTELTNTTGNTILDLAFGDYYIFVLMTNGSIYVSGNNDYGQLGTTSGLSDKTNQTNENGGNTSTIVSLYSQLTLFPNNTGLVPVKIACGSFHNVVIMNNGSLWANGLNDKGQLGIGTTGTAIGPNSTSYITSLTQMSKTYKGKPIAISCGHRHTVVLTFSNQTSSYYLYATGLNDHGQLGTGNKTNYNVLTPMTFFINTPINTVYSTSIPFTPKSISCGYFNTYVLCDNTNLYITGDNTNGQCHGNFVPERKGNLAPNYSSFVYLTNTITQVNGALNGLITSYLSTTELISCFNENTLILTKNGYVKIQDLTKGQLIKTLNHGYIPLYDIGHRTFDNVITEERIKDKLYVCQSKEFPELTQDLVLTGCHSILVDKYDKGEEDATKQLMGHIYTTEDKYRLPVCVCQKTKAYDHSGSFNIYHIALKNKDITMNYGIYANGLLVESASIQELRIFKTNTTI
jgi:alpha-tubulin suppressor-like RCC1 family protein